MMQGLATPHGGAMVDLIVRPTLSEVGSMTGAEGRY
jgi:hypothetical protein